jgi:outer membrane protein assembly factor BamE (lipoprotein component of BamABCDE complex)
MTRIFALVAAALLLALAACRQGSRLTKANVGEVSEGMAKKQVESILGNPTSIDTKDLPTLKTTTYVYNQDNGSVTIVFKDDKVASKESTLRE